MMTSAYKYIDIELEFRYHSLLIKTKLLPKFYMDQIEIEVKRSSEEIEIRIGIKKCGRENRENMKK